MHKSRSFLAAGLAAASLVAASSSAFALDCRELSLTGTVGYANIRAWASLHAPVRVTSPNTIGGLIYCGVSRDDPDHVSDETGLPTRWLKVSYKLAGDPYTLHTGWVSSVVVRGF